MEIRFIGPIVQGTGGTRSVRKPQGYMLVSAVGKIYIRMIIHNVRNTTEKFGKGR